MAARNDRTKIKNFYCFFQWQKIRLLVDELNKPKSFCSKTSLVDWITCFKKNKGLILEMKI